MTSINGSSALDSVDDQHSFDTAQYDADGCVNRAAFARAVHATLFGKSEAWKVGVGAPYSFVETSSCSTSSGGGYCDKHGNPLP